MFLAFIIVRMITFFPYKNNKIKIKNTPSCCIVTGSSEILLLKQFNRSSLINEPILKTQIER